MRMIVIKYMACLLTGMFLFPAGLMASESISLTDQEKKLINQGEVIVREVKTSGKKGKIFEAVGIINAPAKIISQVLSEYKKYPEFMPNISQVKIIQQEGNESVLNYTLSLPLGKIKKYRLKITTAEQEHQDSMVKWELVDWPELKTEETIKDTTGFWLIQEQSHNRSLVLYHVYTDPGPVPFGLGWIVDVLSKNSVPEAFLQTKTRTEKITAKNGVETGKNSR